MSPWHSFTRSQIPASARFDLFNRSRSSGMSVHETGWPRDRDDMRFIAASHAHENVFVNALIHPNRREARPA
jgi:hypothetical protein